ncbi:MAG: hypothetical protein LBH82_02880 [Bacteroidales bacterium]|jgi:hypothetical protein|nr:hypothetical protein [Bacteroidales bacterium]
MKNWKIALTSLFMAGLLFCNCDKYQSTIGGNATCFNSNDNTTYPAAFAVISKMKKENDSLVLVTSVLADANGYFLFDHTTRGTWILKGKKQINDSTFYIGFSDEFSTDGVNHTDMNIQLELKAAENNTQE